MFFLPKIQSKEKLKYKKKKHVELINMLLLPYKN